MFGGEHFIHLFGLETTSKVTAFFSSSKLEDTWIISLAQSKCNGYGNWTPQSTPLGGCTGLTFILILIVDMDGCGEAAICFFGVLLRFVSI